MKGSTNFGLARPYGVRTAMAGDGRVWWQVKVRRQTHPITHRDPDCHPANIQAREPSRSLERTCQNLLKFRCAIRQSLRAVIVRICSSVNLYGNAYNGMQQPSTTTIGESREIDFSRNEPIRVARS